MAQTVRTYYESGELRSEHFELNGKKNGEFKSYHKNGQLCFICSFIDGITNGETKEYTSTGELIRKWILENGNLIKITN